MPEKVNFKAPLPDCEGPKLGPFKHRYAPIEFRRLLSDNASEEAGHAYVFEVVIKSVTYALKVFKFYDDSDARAHLTPRDQRHVTIDLLRAHMDPFYNECRAYGRLIDAKVNGKLAVHCHGYMTLPASIEDELDSKYSVSMWNRPRDEYDKHISKREPLRAIVKDLISDDRAFGKKDVVKMLRALKHLLKLGVYPMDVRSRNFRKGILLDFSIAMTEPHYLFETRPQHQVARYKREDLMLFDRMIGDAKIDTWERATPNRDYKKKLRRR